MTKLNVLKRALASAHLPGDIKLFFFGLYRKDSEKKNARHEGTGAGFIPRSYKNQMTKTQIDQKISEWINNPENDTKNPTIETFADFIGTDKYTLNTYFYKYHNKDFRTWRSEMKIKKARAMLIRKNNALDINQTAEALGFRDKSNFHRLFKQYTGCTPGEWKSTGGHPCVKKQN